MYAGLLALSGDIDVQLLQKTFELAPYDGLMKIDEPALAQVDAPEIVGIAVQQGVVEVEQGQGHRRESQVWRTRNYARSREREEVRSPALIAARRAIWKNRKDNFS